MAKISANGATEMARIKTRNRHGYEYLWVMCSDGRILQRMISDTSSGYTVYRRGWKGDRTQHALIEMASAIGHDIVS